MSVAGQYDKFTQLYAEVNLHALDLVPSDRVHVDNFVEETVSAAGVVLDVGCGPGHVTDYLREAGVGVVGYDVSPNMIVHATQTYPQSSFAVADMGDLPHPGGSVGGILSRYSLIHADPSSLRSIFEHWAHLLEPGAPTTLAFFAADTPQDHGQPFDHKVITAYQLSSEVIVQQLDDAGFVAMSVTMRPFRESERAINHATVTARTQAE